MCVRLGGDEFAVLVHLPEEQAERCLLALRERLNGATSDDEAAAASIGMAMTQPGGRVSDAVRDADLAMYAVKQGRRMERASTASTIPAQLTRRQQPAADV